MTAAARPLAFAQLPICVRSAARPVRWRTALTVFTRWNDACESPRAVSRRPTGGKLMIRYGGRGSSRSKVHELSYMPVVQSNVIDRGEWGGVRGLVAGDYDGHAPLPEASEELDALPLPDFDDEGDQ